MGLACDGTCSLATIPRTIPLIMATIWIHIRSLAQLFDSLDPSPLQKRALDHNAESYMLACVRKHPLRDPMRLLVHFPESRRSISGMTNSESGRRHLATRRVSRPEAGLGMGPRRPGLQGVNSP